MRMVCHRQICVRAKCISYVFTRLKRWRYANGVPSTNLCVCVCVCVCVENTTVCSNMNANGAKC